MWFRNLNNEVKAIIDFGSCGLNDEMEHLCYCFDIIFTDASVVFGYLCKFPDHFWIS